MSSDIAPSESTTFWQSIHQAQATMHSLSLILGPLPDPLTFSENPTTSLLHDANISHDIKSHLHHPDSGSGDDNLCRWLYDTFQSTNPGLQLVVLNFLPTIIKVYLSRAISQKSLAGFEAVLLALYAHETVIRGGEPQTVILPNLTNPSVYHEAKTPTKSKAVDLNIAVLCPALEPFGTVRSTKRARIIGVALELYYNNLHDMPLSSKLEFCEFCVDWAGYNQSLEEEKQSNPKTDASCADQQGEMIQVKGGEDEHGKKGRRIPLPWELFQPILRIVAHCLLGNSNSEELKEAALVAAQCLHLRALHDMNPQAILASRSLLRLAKMPGDTIFKPHVVNDSSDLAASQLASKD
ncbi:Hyccin [Cocos nucifera]|uniref:Hyccin n=1 Tax=Cocos nucifera TaxID=13894 RepID=A0A8K0NEM5_COCNU|nr:Hyccin [Cocos nucifera]